MAEIEANDGFCGQICGRISETDTRFFFFFMQDQDRMETNSKKIYGQICGQ